MHVRLVIRRLNPHAGSATFFRGDLIMKIFSMAILSLLLIQEGQLSVPGERMCIILVNCFRGLSLPSKVC